MGSTKETEMTYDEMRRELDKVTAERDAYTRIAAGMAEVNDPLLYDYATKSQEWSRKVFEMRQELHRAAEAAR